jgi:hypothetical protein
VIEFQLNILLFNFVKKKKLRTLRLFYKKKDIDDLKRAYDSIDLINKSSENPSKGQSSVTGGKLDNEYFTLDSNINAGVSNPSIDNHINNVMIKDKKLCAQLGTEVATSYTYGTNTGSSSNKKKERQQDRSKRSTVSMDKQLTKYANTSYSTGSFSQASEESGSLPISLQQAGSIVQSNDATSATATTASSTKRNSSILSLGVELVQQQLAEANKGLITSKVHYTQPTSVFGVPLSAIMQHTGQPLPQSILEAMKYLRKVAANEVGIFRKSGVKSRINKLKESIDKNEFISFDSTPELTVFDIADTIKLYFRELPECLITNKLSDILLSSYSSNYVSI